MTEQEKKERKNYLQRIRRAKDTKTRAAMFAWNKSEAGKESKSKYRGVGTPAYKKIRQKFKELNAETIIKADSSRSQWTGKEEEKLLKMRASGMKIIEIATVLSRSYKSIERKLSSLKSDDKKLLGASCEA